MTKSNYLISDPSCLGNFPNVTVFKYSIQGRKTENDDTEYRLIGPDGTPMGRSFCCPEEVLDVAREFFKEQHEK